MPPRRLLRVGGRCAARGVPNRQLLRGSRLVRVDPLRAGRFPVDGRVDSVRGLPRGGLRGRRGRGAVLAVPERKVPGRERPHELHGLRAGLLLRPSGLLAPGLRGRPLLRPIGRRRGRVRRRPLLPDRGVDLHRLRRGDVPAEHRGHELRFLRGRHLLRGGRVELHELRRGPFPGQRRERRVRELRGGLLLPFDGPHHRRRLGMPCRPLLRGGGLGELPVVRRGGIPSQCGVDLVRRLPRGHLSACLRRSSVRAVQPRLRVRRAGPHERGRARVPRGRLRGARLQRVH